MVPAGLAGALRADRRWPQAPASKLPARRGAALGAGIPIVAGSDSGNWPIDPYHFHGPTLLREIELLGHAGLPAGDALAAATRIPARMLALENEIGTVEVGKRADLVVLRKDPLRDLRNLRTIRWTIKDGVAKAPADWLAD